MAAPTPSEIDLPEDLSELSDTELEALSAQLAESASEVDLSEVNEAKLAELERAAEMADRVEAEQARRLDLADRAQHLAERFVKPGGDGVDGEKKRPEDEEEEDDSEAKRKRGMSDADLANDDAEELEVDIPVDEAQTEPEPELVEAATAAEAVVEMAARRSNAFRPAKPLAAEIPTITSATAFTPNVRVGERLGGNIEELAQLITTARLRESRGYEGPRTNVPIMTMSADFPEDSWLSNDAAHNFGILRQAGRELEALVASGTEICAPAAPIYDIFRLAQPQGPVEAMLPVVPAPRGGVRVIPTPVAMAADMRGGIDVTGANVAVPDKNYVEVDCPEIVDYVVDAVSQSIRFGNLQYRIFPELVQHLLGDLAVAFTRRKELEYINAIAAGSTGIVSDPPYGASRGIMTELTLAATRYRKRNSMSVAPTPAPLEVMLPDWTTELFYNDCVNDHSLGLANLVADVGLDAALRSKGLNVTWYYYGEAGEGQDLDEALTPGAALVKFPGHVTGYLFAPGTWVRLDGGTLDVGLVRDSTLNRTNDLELFSEQWIQTVFVGAESDEIKLTLCPDGTAPEPATPLDCGS